MALLVTRCTLKSRSFSQVVHITLPVDLGHFASRPAGQLRGYLAAQDAGTSQERAPSLLTQPSGPLTCALCDITLQWPSRNLGYEETAKQEHLTSSFTSKYFRSTDWKTRVSVLPSNLPPKTADTTIPPLPAPNASGHLPSSFPKVASIEQRPVNILCQSKWENRLACASKESSCNGGDPSSISGWGRSP